MIQDSASLSFPQKVSALATGQRYTLEMKSAADNNIPSSADVYFTVSGPIAKKEVDDQRQNILKSHPTSVTGNLAYIYFLLESEYYSEARKELLVLDQDAPLVKRMLMHYYEEIGLDFD